MVEVEGNDTNDNLAYDDNAHKAVFCTNSLILCAWLLFWTHIVFLRLKKTNPMILLHVVTILMKLFCVKKTEMSQFQFGNF